MLLSVLSLYLVNLYFRIWFILIPNLDSLVCENMSLILFNIFFTHMSGMLFL